MGNEKSKMKYDSDNSGISKEKEKSNRISTKPKLLEQQQNQDQNKKNNKNDSLELFLFGCDHQNEQKILAFDTYNETFQVIPKPSNLSIYNYSQAISISKELIALTGGTNKEKNLVSSQAFLYNTVQNKALLLPNMFQARFSHICLYDKNKLFVFGGRSKPGDSNILNHCEYLGISLDSVFSSSWTVMPPTLLKRCTGFAAAFNNDIYLIGGYTGQRKRSKKIEKFVWNTQIWEIINLRLLYGVERGLLLPGNDSNEFMIFGGKIRSGDTNLIFTYNLVTQTYNYIKEMNSERVLQKGFESQLTQYIYMIGGDTQNTIEKAKRSNENLLWNWIKVPFNISIKEQLKQFAHSQSSVIIPHANEIPHYYSEDFSNKEIHVIFGTDYEPMIIVLNVDKNEIRFKPVPNPMRLYGYQGISQLTKGKYFICGGLFYSRKKISKDAYIYDATTHSVLKCQKMIGMRYTMNVVCKDNIIYVIGGRSYGGDHEGILNTCECYDVDKNEWKMIAPLNKKRCTAMCFLINNTIYIAGGYNGNVIRETSFETYNELSNVWNYLAVELSEPLEASMVLGYENKILFVGGRNRSGDSNLCHIYDYTFGIDAMHIEATHKMRNRKCLHKNIIFDKHILLIGGEKYEKEKFLEFIGVENMKNSLEITIDPKNVPKKLVDFSVNVFEKLKEKLKDPKLQKYGFV